MALPTAPLGQMPNMNMPYSIATYEKGPSIWEKALASFLVNAAGGVATKGADNLMQGEHATEFGQKPQSWYGKIMSGPTVGDDEAKQLRAQKFTGEQNDANRLAEQGAADALAMNARMRQGDATQAGLDEQLLRDKNASVRLGQENTAQDTRLGKQLDAQRMLEELKATLDANSPTSKAKAHLDDQMARKYGADAAFTESFAPQAKTGGQGAPGASGPVDPSIAAFKARSGTSGPALPPDPVVGAADVKRFLDQGMTPEQISVVVQRQRAVQSRANAMPLPDVNTPSPTDLQYQQLLKQLGMGKDPSNPFFVHGAGY